MINMIRVWNRGTVGRIRTNTPFLHFSTTPFLSRRAPENRGGTGAANTDSLPTKHQNLHASERGSWIVDRGPWIEKEGILA